MTEAKMYWIKTTEITNWTNSKESPTKHLKTREWGKSFIFNLHETFNSVILFALYHKFGLCACKFFFLYAYEPVAQCSPSKRFLSMFPRINLFTYVALRTANGRSYRYPCMQEVQAQLRLTDGFCLSQEDHYMLSSWALNYCTVRDKNNYWIIVL